MGSSAPIGAAALSGDDGFQIRTGGVNHKIPSKFGERAQHQFGVFLPGGFAGDDRGAGLRVGRGIPRQRKLAGHQLTDSLAVQKHVVHQWGGAGRATVENGFVRD